MGMITELADQFDLSHVESCCLCGKKSTAYWRGEKWIGICRWCAIDDLPKLMADAVVGGGAKIGADLHHACGQFWRAAALSLEIKQRESPPSP